MGQALTYNHSNNVKLSLVAMKFILQYKKKKNKKKHQIVSNF